MTLRLVSKAVRSTWAPLRELPLKAAVALGSAGMGEPPRADRLWKAMALVMPVALLTWWAIPQLTLVMSPSIDAWAVRAVPGVIRSGDLVSFELRDVQAGANRVAVTKYALCLPGQMLSEFEHPSRAVGRGRDGYYYCDGRLLGVSKAFGMRGQALQHLRWGHHVIPDGYVYVGSAHPDGFDSRYYGPVAVKRLTRMERVL